MKKQSFSVKDLISANLLPSLIFAVVFAGGIIGFIPIFMPLIPSTCTLCSGLVFMFYNAKIHRFGVMLIMGTTAGLLLVVTGHGIYILPGIMLLVLIGECILKEGNYENLNHTRWRFTVYSLVSGSMMILIYITHDAYIRKLIDQGYGQAYVDKTMSVLPNWIFLFILLLGAIGGYPGTATDIRMLRKRFKKLSMA